MAGHGRRGSHGHRRAARRVGLPRAAAAFGPPGRRRDRPGHRPGREADRAYPDVRPPGPPATSGVFRRGNRAARARPGLAVRPRREALALFTGWLFGHAAAEVIEGSTDPANAAMRAVFQRAGWTFAGPVTEVGREWDQYRITRDDWASAERAAARRRGRTAY